MIRRCLSPPDFEVREALVRGRRSGDARSSRPHVILLDLVMAGGTVRGAGTPARGRRMRDIPVIG